MFRCRLAGSGFDFVATAQDGDARIVQTVFPAGGRTSWILPTAIFHLIGMRLADLRGDTCPTTPWARAVAGIVLRARIGIGGSNDDGSQTLKLIRVMLEYFHPWTSSAGFYIARERGWYREIGLDVAFMLYDHGRGDTLDYLARGEADFGIAPSKRLFERHERGEPLMGIAAINQRGLDTVRTLSSTGIHRPRDLERKRIALNPTKRGLAMIRYLVERDGGDPDAMTIVDSGLRELTAEAIASGDVDATFGSYWVWETLMPSTVPAHESIVWPIDEIGAPPYHSYLLCTHHSWLEADPDLVRAFLEVTQRGYMTALARPDLVLPIYERMTPYFPAELLERSLPVVASTWVHGGQWGAQREVLLSSYASWLADHGLLREADVWKRATSNEFPSASSDITAAMA